MPAKRDLVGQVFNRLLVLEETDPFISKSGKKTAAYICQCECSNIVVARGPDIVRGAKKSCGCLRTKDLLNQTFGNLTVLEKADPIIEKNGERRAAWLCQCECGQTVVVREKSLICGESKSCGCQKQLNLIGMRFGRLLVLAQMDSIIDNDGHHYSSWLCQCECGNQVVVRGRSLSSGDTKSCGCLHKEIMTERGKNSKLNIIGQKFGRLTVIRDSGLRKGEAVLWECQCECGNIVNVSTGSLTGKNENTRSCGCLKSKGEAKIAALLTSLNIDFTKQYSMRGSKKKSIFRFDFYLPQYNLIIEYDGVQHFEKTFNDLFDYEDTKARDKEKEALLLLNNILLLRIPYTEYNILTEQYLVKAIDKALNNLKNDQYITHMNKDLYRNRENIFAA